jgi:stage V sporulation protein D (sporulation-specific penicillin-binding protein)
MVDDPQGGAIYGSLVAAPVVSEVFREALPYLEIFRTQLSEEIIVPYLVGFTINEATERLSSIGLQYNIIGAGAGGNVLRTIPRDGQPIAQGGIVQVFMAEEDNKNVTIPNVIGLSPARANEILTNAGLNIRLTGTIHNDRATAFMQSIDPGEIVPEGTVVEVKFMFVDGHAG